jgi:hypothetical protein
MTRNSVSVPSDAKSTAIILGFWSSIFAAIFATLFAILAIAFSPSAWTGIEAYSRSMNILQMVNMIPVILLAFTVIVVMACIHYVAPESKKVFSLIAIAFTSSYATIICVNYYIQLYVVRLNIINGNLDGLSLLVMPNFYSVFFALEALGYSFLCIASLFIIPIITGGRLASWIRILLLISGVLGIFGTIIAPFDQPMLIFAGLGIWSIAFPIAMVLLGIYFRNLHK